MFSKLKTDSFRKIYLKWALWVVTDFLYILEMAFSFPWSWVRARWMKIITPTQYKQSVRSPLNLIQIEILLVLFGNLFVIWNTSFILICTHNSGEKLLKTDLLHKRFFFGFCTVKEEKSREENVAKGAKLFKKCYGSWKTRIDWSISSFVSC